MNNRLKFEKVDVDDLTNSYYGLKVIHLTVDTTSDYETEWIVIDRSIRENISF